MEIGTIQFLVFLLIIIVIKESWGFDGSVSLEISPWMVSKSGDTVTVSWTGVVIPSKFDFLGIYTPPDSENQNYIGWIELSSIPGWESGSGSVDLPLVNMRMPMEFRLFRGRAMNATNSTAVDEDRDPLPATDVRLAVSQTVEFANYNEPTQIHLALTSDPKEMRVMFVTRDGIESFVKYGLDSLSLSSVSKATSETYNQMQMCDAPANTARGWRDPGVIHDAVMGNLVPGKPYFYQVGSKEGGWSDVYRFVFPDTSAEETNALLFGDMGTTAPYKTFLWLQQESQLTLQWLQRDIQEVRGRGIFISHIGDISYARGYEWLWDEFFHRIQPVATQVAYHVCIGNHEYDWPEQPWKPEFADYGTDGGGECGVPYSLKFHMPGNSSQATGTTAPATRNLYYSLSVGVVHFLYFSTETNFLIGSDQYKFIDEDLGNVDREKNPFLVLLGHRPMYTTDIDKGSIYKFKDKMVENLEPLLLKHNVNLVLWGHVHKYERTCPMQNFTCSLRQSSPGLGQAPVHVVIGMGGQDWQPSWQPRAGHGQDPIFPQPQWCVYRGDEFGYVRLHATKTVLTLNYVGNHDGQVHDVFEIRLKEEGKVLFPHVKQWLWGFLCFSFALILGAAIGIMFSNWKNRDSRTRQRSVTSARSYQKVLDRETIEL